MVDLSTGFVSFEWQQWLQNPEFLTVTIDSPLPVGSGGTGQTTNLLASLEMAGPTYLATPTGQTSGAAQQSVALWAGLGAPDDATGQNGDFYFRGNGTAAANNVIYHKEAGAWVALVTT